MSKIKASTLLRNVELASLGAIRDMIADEVERLKAAEQAIVTLAEGIKPDATPDELPPVKERKPLRDTRELPWYMLIKDGKRIPGSGCAFWETVKKIQLDYPDSRVAQVMAPDESGNCPTQYIDNVQLGCEYEWAIYKQIERAWIHEERIAPTFFIDGARRFPAKADAQAFIKGMSIDDAIPFPVPRLREA